MDTFTLAKKLPNSTVILPIGAVEAHGKHLPINIDSELAKSYAQKLAPLINAIVYPCLNYGQVWGLYNFAGSVDIGTKNLVQNIYQIACSLQKDQVKRLVILNTHIGNQDAIKQAARLIFEKKLLEIYYFMYPGLSKNINLFKQSNNPYGFMHADEIETSIALYLTPNLVHIDQAEQDNTVIPKKIIYQPLRWENFAPKAILNNPQLASRQKGKIVIKDSLKIIAKILNDE